VGSHDFLLLDDGGDDNGGDDTRSGSKNVGKEAWDGS